MLTLFLMLNRDGIVKACTKADRITSKELIQSLWSDYGEIIRYTLSGAVYSSIVVKHIKISELKIHPKGWSTSNSHARKVKSYEVEGNWYQFYEGILSSKLRMPKLIELIKEGGEIILILEDLDHKGFSVREKKASIFELKQCISWLATLHGNTLLSESTGLWSRGTYWHLQTRIDEYNAMEDSPLKSCSNQIDSILNRVKYKCILHGDPKLANFCFHNSDDSVAGLDFQYTGSGCGMQDIVYLIGSAISPEACFQYENELIEFYFHELKKHVKNVDFNALKKEWSPLFTIAWADFNRFLMGWMPGHEKLNKYSDHITLRALDTLEKY